MNNVVLKKKKCEKTQDIKLVTTERNYLVSEPHYKVYTTKFFTENVLETEIRKT